MQTTKTVAGGLNFLWAELTSRCNLRCVHCYGRFGETAAEKEMTFPEWKGVLQAAYACGCRRMQFTGGEALLSPFLTGLIQEARGIGYDLIEVFTNATRIGEKEIHSFQENQVHLAVSVYGDRPEVHDSITGVPGSFRSTESSLKALRRAGVPFRIAVILMRRNRDRLDGMAEWMRQMGASNDFHPDPVRPAGRGANPELRAEPLPRPTRRPGGFYPGHPLQAESGLTTCWKGKIAVTAQGDVLPCIFARDLGCGNLREHSLEEVISDPALQGLWRLTVEDVPECRECTVRSFCADCRFLAYAESGDLHARNPRCPGVSRNREGVSSAPREGWQRPQSFPERSSEVSFRRIDDELLLYHRRNHRTHLLNPSSLLLWSNLDGSHSFEDLTRIFLEHFDASAEAIRTDLEILLSELDRSELIAWEKKDV